MAISPFTKPVKQGEFIPKKPRLPVESIARATQNIDKRITKHQDRLAQVENKLAQENVAEKDRQAWNQYMNRIRGEIEKLTENPMDLFGAREKVTELARDASSNLQTAKRAKKLRQKQVEEIEDTQGLDQREREVYKQYLSDPSLQLNEQGNLDPSTLPSVRKLGDQPEDGPYDALVDASQGLKERFAQSQPKINEDMGWAKIVEQSGVTWDRIYGAMKREIDSNPRLRDWKNNQTMLETQRLLRSGKYDNIENAREQARKTVEDNIDTLARNTAKNRAHKDLEYSLRNLTDVATSSQTEGEGFFTVDMPPTGIDQYAEGSAGRREALDRAEAMYKSRVQSKFSEDERETIERARREASRRAGKEIRTDDVLAVIKPGMDPITEKTKEGQMAKILKQENPELWSRYQDFVTNTKEQATSMEYAPKAYMPMGLKEKNIETLREGLKIANSNNQLKSKDVQVQSEDANSDGWLPFDGPIDNAINKITSSAQRMAITDDGRHLVVTTGPVGESGSNTTLEDRTYRISTKNLDNNFLTRLTSTFDDQTKRTINDNIKYRNVVITDDNPLQIGENAQVSKTYNTDPENNRYSETYSVSVDGSELTYSGLADRMKDSNPEQVVQTIVSKARQEGFTSINSIEKVQDALEEYNSSSTGDSTSNKVEALVNLMNQKVNYKHRGPAIQTASILTQE